MDALPPCPAADAAWIAVMALSILLLIVSMCLIYACRRSRLAPFDPLPQPPAPGPPPSEGASGVYRRQRK